MKVGNTSQSGSLISVREKYWNGKGVVYVAKRRVSSSLLWLCTVRYNKKNSSSGWRRRLGNLVAVDKSWGKPLERVKSPYQRDRPSPLPCFVYATPLTLLLVFHLDIFSPRKWTPGVTTAWHPRVTQPTYKKKRKVGNRWRHCITLRRQNRKGRE